MTIIYCMYVGDNSSMSVADTVSMTDVKSCMGTRIAESAGIP